MGMRQKGIAVVAALSLVAVMALLSLAMVQSALASLRTGGDLFGKAQARQLAEAGLDQGIAFLASLRPEDISQDRFLSGSLSTGSYQVALRCAQAAPRRFDCEVHSTGESTRATHRAKALVEVGLEERSFLQEGWFTGGTVRVNGRLSLMASRLHGDGGYTLRGPTPQLCDASGGNCTQDPQALKRAVTASVDYGVCNASGLCPPQTVCPVWGRPPANDNRPCYDSLAGRMATVSTSTRIPPPDVASLYASLTGTSLTDNPYARLAPSSCDHTAASSSDLLSILASTSSGTVCLNSSLNLSSPLVVPPGVKLVVRGGVAVNWGASVTVRGELYVQGNWNASGGSLSVEGGRVVVGGNMASASQLTVSGGTLLVGGNLNLNSGNPTFRNALLAVRYSGTFGVSLQAEDSKLVFGSGLTFNGSNRPNLDGNTLLATTNSMTFNGSLRSNLRGSPLLVSNGDVTFNGSYRNAESASYIWAGGTVRMNGNTEYRGGIASGGGVQTSSLADGIVVNGGLTLFRANLGNDFLPKVETLALRVTSRR
jgi:formylmethanofuran dehydrogenase subunit C